MSSFQSARPFSQIWAASNTADLLTTWSLSPRHSLGLNGKTRKNVTTLSLCHLAMLVGKPSSEGGLSLPWQTGDLWVDWSNLGGKTGFKAFRAFRVKGIQMHAGLTAKKRKAQNPPSFTCEITFFSITLSFLWEPDPQWPLWLQSEKPLEREVRQRHLRINV